VTGRDGNDLGELQLFVVLLGAAMNVAGQPVYVVQERLTKMAAGSGARTATVSALPTWALVTCRLVTDVTGPSGDRYRWLKHRRGRSGAKGSPLPDGHPVDTGNGGGPHGDSPLRREAEAPRARRSSFDSPGASQVSCLSSPVLARSCAAR